MVEFRVVPKVLREVATQVAEVATAWQQTASTIRGATLGGDDYGFLGRELVAAYMQTADKVATKLENGHQRINQAASDLDRAATGFENVDASYYRKFGYLAE